MGDFVGGERVGRKGPITSVGSEATCQRIVSLINGALTLVSATGSIAVASGSHFYTHIHSNKEQHMRLSPLSWCKKESVCLVGLHSVCIKAPL